MYAGVKYHVPEFSLLEADHSQLSLSLELLTFVFDLLLPSFVFGNQFSLLRIPQDVGSSLDTLLGFQSFCFLLGFIFSPPDGGGEGGAFVIGFGVRSTNAAYSSGGHLFLQSTYCFAAYVS